MCLGEPCSPSFLPKPVSERRDKGFCIYNRTTVPLSGKECGLEPRTVIHYLPDNVILTTNSCLTRRACSVQINPTSGHISPVGGLLSPSPMTGSHKVHPGLTP